MTDRTKPLTVPAFGVIKGGRLAGWRFHFIRFRVDAAGLTVLAKCTPPRWPFPCDIPLDHSHFTQLRAIPGERAKRIEAEGLIRAAYSYAGLDAPAWLDKPATLRARVKRSAGTRKA